MRLTTERALQVLGLLPAEALSARSIRAAFARRSKEMHPDTAMQIGGGEAAWRVPFDDLKAARDYLLSEAKAADCACKACGGRGKMRASLGWRQCGACAGTGDKR